jgi:myo-inositol-1(or 4)-monophosphatase
VTTTSPGTIERACIDVVSSILDEYRPRLAAAALDRDTRERHNPRHQDNFLSDFDMALHEQYKAALAQQLGGFFYLSEEAEPEAVGAPSDLVILVDPLDTSELAVRGLNGYTHLLAYSMTQARPLAAVVGDFYHHIDLYYATDNNGRPRAMLRTRDGATHAITVPTRSPSDRLLVTSYNMRPSERFVPLANQTKLLDLLTHGTPDHHSDGPTGDRNRIGVNFGSVGLCHVATGATDAFVEFAKGFALWDLLPGQFILESAGGDVYDLNGQPLPWPTGAFTDLDTMQTAMNSRQTFIATGTPAVATTIATTIDV